MFGGITKSSDGFDHHKLGGALYQKEPGQARSSYRLLSDFCDEKPGFAIVIFLLLGKIVYEVQVVP